MAYLTKTKNITSIHDNIVTWRKELEVLRYIIHPRDISTPNISTTCPAVTAEFSTSFKASSSLQVIAKPPPTASKLAQGYRDFKILRVRLTDRPILAKIISQDFISRLSSIWGVRAAEEDLPR
jgi:hypothetical protein